MPTSHGEPKSRNSDGALAHGPAQANVAGAASGSYTATEQGMLNNMVTAVNAILAALRSEGTIAS